MAAEVEVDGGSGGGGMQGLGSKQLDIGLRFLLRSLLQVDAKIMRPCL